MRSGQQTVKKNFPADFVSQPQAFKISTTLQIVSQLDWYTRAPAQHKPCCFKVCSSTEKERES